MASIRTISSDHSGRILSPSTRSLNNNSTHEDAESNNIRPFFILVEDTTSTEVVHPDVHYIFADDGLDELTAATLKVTEPSQDIAEADHRIVIVDLASDAKTVTKVSSLSPDWQVTNVEVDHAPSWQGHADDTGKNMLLRVSGSSARGASDAKVSSTMPLPDLVAMLNQELESLEMHMAGYEDPVQPAAEAAQPDS